MAKDPLSFLTDQRKKSREEAKEGMKPKPKVEPKKPGLIERIKEKFSGSLRGKAGAFRPLRKPGATAEGMIQQRATDTGDSYPKSRQYLVDNRYLKEISGGKYEVIRKNK